MLTQEQVYSTLRQYAAKHPAQATNVEKRILDMQEPGGEQVFLTEAGVIEEFLLMVRFVYEAKN